jgi:uncharacterized protein YxeA
MFEWAIVIIIILIIIAEIKMFSNINVTIEHKYVQDEESDEESDEKKK